VVHWFVFVEMRIERIALVTKPTPVGCYGVPRNALPHLTPETKTAAVIASAAELAAEHGFEYATLWRISRASGVPERTIVHHFGNKEGVLRELCREHISALTASVLAADQPLEMRRRRLDALALALIDAINARAAAHEAVLQAKHWLSREDREDLRQRQRWVSAIFTEAIEAVLPALKRRPGLTKPAVISLLVLLNQHGTWFREGGPMRRTSYASFAVTAVLSGLRQHLRGRPGDDIFAGDVYYGPPAPSRGRVTARSKTTTASKRADQRN
jgi:TetR/AcrR family transcriptional regulator